MTREEIAAVMERIPLLTDFGMGIGEPLTGSLTREERDARVKEQRGRLLASERGCTLACEWLADKEKIETINTRHSSYGYKNMVEREAIERVSNGSFIAATIHCGFPYEIDPHSPNVRFGISEKSLKGHKAI
jgi:hypothetical protein